MKRKFYKGEKMVKKFLVSSSLIATLVSGAFSQDVYSYISIGSNENFNDL